jgi:hypothetical protein
MTESNELSGCRESHSRDSRVTNLSRSWLSAMMLADANSHLTLSGVRPPQYSRQAVLWWLRSADPYFVFQLWCSEHARGSLLSGLWSVASELVCRRSERAGGDFCTAR